ncbi:carnitine 3-dehydrogenase [Brucella intermedia]|uniref:carnitine 3-dehydrogenase n=1 Tax=Brucella intermedia TaxID=94625 RepID=UPI00124F5FF2|nr:carnitine 3-dehydrogenase [Brucella intermedia]KAB2717679.1 carnitine 3-dehydrogenase [Brucella intermedia]
MNSHPPKIACIGSGVIGSGWAARFLLNGFDVAVYDPSPDARATTEHILDNARKALAALTTVRLPQEGRLSFSASLAEAVEGAVLIQESVPERLDLKLAVMAEIEASCSDDALIASSTSGFLPSKLQAGLRHPGRLLIAHPYNPVYLLPLVELVPGEKTAVATIESASALYRQTGMEPVVLEKEIDAFVGDRLLEALWREALWLVRDGIATVEQIDDIIRYSFGLRWAQMGLFQTYRIAGGPAGMRHFLAQFGPALQWPWTKLTDVPDLDDSLIDRIADQSDAQNEGLSIRDLERIRDENLVAIIRALSQQQQGKGWGAGALLNNYTARLETAADRPDAGSGPLRLLDARVIPEWIDYNGHMTEHRYLDVFGQATDRFLAHIGVDDAYLKSGHSYYTVETHIMHRGEAKAGDELHVETQLLSFDEKRAHVFHSLRRGDAEIASAEQMLLHVDSKAGKAVAAKPGIREALERLFHSHQEMPTPIAVGRHVGIRG